MATGDVAAQRLMLVEPVVRRVLVARVGANVVDDLVQDTVERLMPAARRLPIDELTPYAVVAAQNAARTRLRRDARSRRLQAEMVERDWTDGPEGEVVAAEEAAAVARAMSTLDVGDQDLLRAHHLDGEETASIARRSERTEMAVRVHLARARAKLRVAYAVEDSGTSFSSQRCRRVLEALALGDRRGQARLGVDDHVKGCSTCAALVAPVTGARRPAVGLFAAALLWWRTASTGVRSALVGGGTAVAAGTVALVVASQGLGPAPEQAAPPPAATAVPTTPVPTTTPGRVQTSDGALPSSPAGLAGRGGPVSGRSVPVRAVPTDEGFWITADDGGQLWVELVGAQEESTVTVAPGAAVSFEGELVENAPSFVEDIGLAAEEGADELMAQSHHLQVPVGGLRLG